MRWTLSLVRPINWYQLPCIRLKGNEIYLTWIWSTKCWRKTSKPWMERGFRKTNELDDVPIKVLLIMKVNSKPLLSPKPKRAIPVFATELTHRRCQYADRNEESSSEENSPAEHRSTYYSRKCTCRSTTWNETSNNKLLHSVESQTLPKAEM